MSTHLTRAHRLGGTRRRGATLLELLIAVAILGFALAAASSLVVVSGRMIRNSQEIVDSNDGSRTGGEIVAHAIESAGFGASGGVWVNWPGVGVTQTNAIFGTDGLTGQGYAPPLVDPNQLDQLWVIVPNGDAMQPSYSVNPSGTPVAFGGTVAAVRPGAASPLAITNTDNFSGPSPLPSGNVLTHLALVTNLNSAALLTVTGTVPEALPATPGQLQFAEQGLANFSEAPGKGDFKVGDLAFEVRVLHFFVGPSTPGNTGLHRAWAMPAPGGGPGIPFNDIPGTDEVIQDRVEDFQVAFAVDTVGAGNPSDYLFQNGLPARYTPSVRSVRISVVALGKGPVRDQQNQIVINPNPGRDQVGVPLGVENRPFWPGGAPPFPGYRRSLYQRRVEAVNLASGLL